MTKPSELTLAFLNRRPEAAARVLTSLAASDAAAFLDAIPTRYAVSVLSSLNARATATILKLMDVTAATAIIREMDFGVAAAVLRYFTAADREALLHDLPRRRRRALEISLAYAPDTVGARMTTEVWVLGANDTVDDGLSMIRDNPGGGSNRIFIVDGQRKLLGVVRLPILLRHPASTVLKELIGDSFVQASPQARLEVVATLDAWNNCSELPVISRRGEFMGAITRKACCSSGADGVASFAASQSPAATLLHAMGDCSRELVQLFTHLSIERDEPRDSNGR